MVTRKEQKEKKTEEILLAALDLFIKKGYAATKTSEISKAVHMSEGLLFHYFKSKEVLLEVLVDIAMQTNDQWVMSKDIEPILYFETIAESVLACLKEDQAGAKFFVLVAQLKQNEGIPEAITKKIQVQEQNVERVVSIIQKGQKEGTIKKGNPYTLAWLFSDLLQTIALHHAMHEDSILPEVSWIMDVMKNHD